MPEGKFPQKFLVAAEERGQRLDQYLADKLIELSRVRVQQMIEQKQVQVGEATAKASLRLRGGETIMVFSPARPPEILARPEAIPIAIVYEDDDLAVIDKPAGMLVHSGGGLNAGSSGTLVNALLHHFAGLSSIGGAMRPGIVHRLDKGTSGLILVAKNDLTHRKLSAQFAARQVKKKYLALVHGWPKNDQDTVRSAISRDRVRRTRMTTRRSGGREAVSHYRVTRRLKTLYGKFALVEVRIETGRTHQIRVHLSSLGHPVVGDTVYGAPRTIEIPEAPPEQRKKKARAGRERETKIDIGLERNFLHAAAIEFRHPRSDEILAFGSRLPRELEEFLTGLTAGAPGN